jgi:ADP-heptose:LPS heptosyltransferase
MEGKYADATLAQGGDLKDGAQKDAVRIDSTLPKPEPGDRVLWIRFWAFGDALESAADAFNFKKQFPDVRLSFLSIPMYAELFRVQPYIDEALGGYKKPFREWVKTLKQIRTGGYKWIVSGQHGGSTALLVRFSGADYRIGTCSIPLMNLNYHFGLKQWLGHCGVDAQDRSSRSIFAADSDREEGLAMLAGLPERRLFAAIGAGHADKMWQAEKWIELLGHALRKGWGIVLNGYGPVEEAIGRQIEDAVASRNLLNLTGKLSCGQIPGVVHSCAMALGNDTGPLHLAALSGLPTMGLFSRSTSRKMGLRMPWFREFCAAGWGNCGKAKIPLKALPAEPVIRAFDDFADEFLPKAFRWRGK